MGTLTPRVLLYPAFLCTLVGSPLVGQSQAPRATILGEWQGTSTCTRAAWNAGCNDEQNVYVFTRTASPDSVAEQAYKLVGGSYDLMGGNTLTYDPRRQEWFADFSNARVSIRISYQVTDTVLTGRVTDLRTSRVERQVTARRATTSKLPPN